VKTNNRSTFQKGGFNNRLLKIKLLGGVWIGKILITLTRLFGRGGTTLPGRIALKSAPYLPAHLTAGLTGGTIIVTGTNGKTTTSAQITAILKTAGFKCIHNQSGSNMSWGVATALISATSWRAKLTADYAVMEVDEGAFPGVTGNIQPQGIVVTNIFRDQLDRYGEIDHIQNSIKRGLEAQPETGFQVINADDPSLAAFSVSSGKRQLTFGLGLDLPEDTFQNTGRDIKTCPRCQEKLAYDKIYFAHLGHYRCLTCSYSRPAPDVTLDGLTINPDGSALLKLSLFGESFELTSPLLGTYNLYNILAAVTCAKALAIPNDLIARAVGQAVPSFGRMEKFEFEGKTLIMALIKNPVGANEVLRTILAQPDDTSILIAINDKIADGTDVSWLWDVDFEQLSMGKTSFTKFFVSGLRAWDMAVRLKYAGLETDRIRVEEDSAKAIEAALAVTRPGGRLFILPSYTAMLEMRRTLNKMGLGKPYWEE
jgi:lipid II isoglutaminyl synthase (glutamine-hydrolysing)